MRPIVIQDERTFVIEGHTLVYDCYHIDTPSYDVGPNRETFRLVLSRWASALCRSREDGQTFYFPFAPDDEWTDVLRGTIDGSSLSLTRGYLGVPGWAVDFENLEDFIISPYGPFPSSQPPIFSESMSSILEDDVEGSASLKLIVDVEEFIEKLKTPRVNE